MTAAGRHVSLPSTFATGFAVQWFRQFEICSKANDWNEATQALKMPTLLEGEALAIWMELEEDNQKDYKTAMKDYRENDAHGFHHYAYTHEL